MNKKMAGIDIDPFGEHESRPEALPGIIGGIISWILNSGKDVVGWVSQNLWTLVVGIGGLIYTYMVTRR